MAARAVIFDLDGTLLDTLEDICQAVNAALRGHGAPPRPKDHYRLLVGDGVPHLVRNTFPAELLREPGEERLIESVRTEYARRADAASAPYPGVAELLDALAAHETPTAILSNKPEPFALRAVELALGRWRFRRVRGARPDAPLKPDPRAALEIAADLGVPPEEIVFLGDTAVDMKTARAAGMRAAGALWGFRGREELEASGAQDLLERPTDLVPLLD
ncbi:MAG TPA: HAD family hydrolase [Elusimicrobiota bacterium]|nr:HAD family hydrolase [Elusimicrobiota bacterium]